MSSGLMVENQEGVTIVRFVDRDVVDAGAIDRMNRELNGLVDAAMHPCMVISFSNVDHMSSAAIGVLVSLNTRIQGKSGQLRLSGLSKDLSKVFRITNLHKLFQIHETSGQAIASLK